MKSVDKMYWKYDNIHYTCANATLGGDSGEYNKM